MQALAVVLGLRVDLRRRGGGELRSGGHFQLPAAHDEPFWVPERGELVFLIVDTRASGGPDALRQASGLVGSCSREVEEAAVSGLGGSDVREEKSTLPRHSLPPHRWRWDGPVYCTQTLHRCLWS